MSDLREQLQQDLGSAYTLEQELGGGGMSRVFVATDNSLGRQVVIKILPPEMAAAVSSQRFRREIQLAANLQHPHIVPLHSAGEINGLPYFTMPYVKGESLRAHLVKVGELPLSEAIRTLREVASALAYAHENNVVHRDIKPENVLISGGSAVVTDFGVAKALSASSGDTGSSGVSLTSMGIALGTPAYMAPEQATADPHTDHRADIYALGVMAYEMITGQTPFTGRSPQATLAAHVTEAPESITKRRSNIPPGLAAIVMRTLEKRPADRYQTAHDVMHDLDALSTPSGGMTPTASYRVPKTRRWLVPAIAAAAAIVLGSSVWFGFASRSAAAPAAATIEKSIAVLPFKNLSGDPANEYLGDGLSEELLNVLAQIPGLRVAARSSSFQFKGKTTDIREIGSKLGVTSVLDGSVRKTGDKLRVTAQLIDAKSGYQIWTETFDRTAGDMLAVQDEITTAIGQSLQVRFGVELSTHSQKPEAFESYLKGVYASNRGGEAGHKQALLHYKDALSKDSTYAAAWSRIAITYINLSGFGYMRQAEALPLAEKAAQRAIALNPDLPNSMMAQAALLRMKGDVERGDAAMAAIVEKYPNLSAPHVEVGNSLLRKGRIDEALREVRIAVQLDPMSVSRRQSLGLHLVMGRRFKDAIAELRKAAAMDPEDTYTAVNLAQALAEDGQHAEAVAVNEKAVASSPDDPFIEMMLAYIYAKAGRRDDAMKIVRKWESSAEADGFAFEMASVHAALGEKDKAFAKLDRLASISGIYFKLDPMLDGIRDDPRFDAFLSKWKLK